MISGNGDNSSNRLPPKPSKFFKSRNVSMAVTEAIQEEDEEEVEEEESRSENETVVEASFKTPGNKTLKSENNILVGIRVRPLQAEEDNVVEMVDTQVVVASEKVFNFDLMFGSEVGQETVYRQLVEERVQAVLDGFNATVFAYGQTGTGKTFSMGTSNGGELLEDEGRGVITRALQHVFTQLKDKKEDHHFLTIKISFLEIKKEQVYDLLNPSKARVPLQVRELQPGSFSVVQLTEIEVTSITEAVNLLHTGGRLRTTESTAVNQNSSRSHAVFSISLVSADPEGNTVTRKLNLVDLAGSESLNKTGAVGSRFEEAKKINLGLTVLNRVITGLSKRQGHIPYRDSVLTKVLKESLEAHCYVSMLACVSPSSGDVQETLNTLRFSNEAKNLKTNPLPASLLDSCRASAARKRAAGLGILSTPLNRGNNTIHGLTPNSGQNKRPAFNRTIGTPGKRAKMEQSYVRGREAGRVNHLTSTVSKNILAESLCDISAVEPSQGTSSNVSAAPSAHDMTGLLSPLMRTIRENMQEEFEKLRSDLIQSKAASKTPKITKRSKSRATSSPNKTIMTLQDMDEETDTLPSHIEVTETEGDNIISGLGMTFPHRPRSVNPRFRAVMESASPEFSRNPQPLLPHYESPASSSSAGAVEDSQARAPASPTIEEMERTLGINPNSPSLMFSVQPSEPGTVLKKSRKSSRRTTLLGSDLSETLKEIQNFANSNRRRSVRTATKGVFYGSPSQIRSDKENPEGSEQKESPHLRHPLLDNERKMDPAKQIKHNQTILDFVNIGNTKQLGVSYFSLSRCDSCHLISLQGLPAVGPKTAFLIHQHRGLHGCFDDLRQLEIIPGLNKNFFKKFCKQNQIDGLEDIA